MNEMSPSHDALLCLLSSSQPNAHLLNVDCKPVRLWREYDIVCEAQFGRVATARQTQTLMGDLEEFGFVRGRVITAAGLTYMRSHQLDVRMALIGDDDE